MIILRKVLTKIFSSRETLSSLRLNDNDYKSFIESNDFNIPENWDGLYDEIIVDVGDCSYLFNKEMPLLDSVERKIARRFKEDLKKGYLFEDHQTNDNTHELKQFSKSHFQVWSKSISAGNRFNYDVSRPYLDEKCRRVIYKADIRNLFDHKYKEVHYSGDNEA